MHCCLKIILFPWFRVSMKTHEKKQVPYISQLVITHFNSDEGPTRQIKGSKQCGTFAMGCLKNKPFSWALLQD